MGGITWKGPLRPDSLSYQKKDGRVWYDTDFLDFFFWIFFSFFHAGFKQTHGGTGTPPIFILVAPRLRTLGTFSRGAPQIIFVGNVIQ